MTTISSGNPQKRRPAVRWRRIVAAASLALSATILSAAYASGIKPTASTAATLNAKDEAHLHLTHTNGSLLVEEGPATGTIPGKVKANFTVAANITANVTIYTHNGSITGHGTGALRGAGLYQSFGGTLKVTGGSERYKHAHGSAGFYGAINRRTDAMTVQTTGKLAY